MTGSQPVVLTTSPHPPGCAFSSIVYFTIKQHKKQVFYQNIIIFLNFLVFLYLLLGLYDKIINNLETKSTIFIYPNNTNGEVDFKQFPIV